MQNGVNGDRYHVEYLATSMDGQSVQHSSIRKVSLLIIYIN